MAGTERREAGAVAVGRRGGKTGKKAPGDADSAAAADRGTPNACVKLQINLPGGKRLGPGKIQLLELIETEGSLSRAAEKMGISYRRAWVFVQQVNAAFDEPAIATPEHGHGGAAAKLTDFGRQLISRFRELEEAANSDGSRFLKWLARHEQAD